MFLWFLLLGHLCACEGFNVLVVGSTGSGKSRVVNAVLHSSGLNAHPVVVGNKASTKPVTTRVGRYCAPSGNHDGYVCWYDTPGLDICPCLTQCGECGATSHLDKLLKGQLPGGAWPPPTSSPSSLIHSIDLVIFVSSGSGASATACGRRLTHHVSNQTDARIPVVVVLTTVADSTTFSIDATPIVSLPVFNTGKVPADELLEVVQPYIDEAHRRTKPLEDEHPADADDADDAALSKLTAEEAALGARLEAWSAEKVHRVDENRKADLAAQETAQRVLFVGLLAVAAALAVRFVSYLFTTGVGTSKKTYSWFSIAGARVSRLGIAVTKSKSKLALEKTVSLARMLYALLKSLAAYIAMGLKVVGAKLYCYLLAFLGLGLKLLDGVLRFFPEMRGRLKEAYKRYMAARAEKEMQKRGVDGAKVCSSCMSPIDVKKTGVEVQTSNPPSPEIPMLQVTDTTRVEEVPTTPPSPPSPPPAPKLSWKETIQTFFTRPAVNEVIDVLWSDEVLYEATVMAVIEKDVNVKWAEEHRSQGSYSTIPIDRVVRRPFFARWAKVAAFFSSLLVLPVFAAGKLSERINEMYAMHKKAVEERKRRKAMEKLEPWDKRKPDIDHETQGSTRRRRNSLPVVQAKPATVTDFPSQHRERRESGREGGYFMDTVGAPVGTTFEDICTAADSLQTSLHQKLSEAQDEVSPYELVRSKTSELPTATSISPIRTPYHDAVVTHHSYPLVNRSPESGIISPPSPLRSALAVRGLTSSPRYSSVRRAVVMSPSEAAEGREPQGYGYCTTPPPVKLTSFPSGPDVCDKEVGRGRRTVAPPSTPASHYTSCKTPTTLRADTPSYKSMGSASDAGQDMQVESSTLFFDDTPADFPLTPADFPLAHETVPTPMELPLPTPFQSPAATASPPPPSPAVGRATTPVARHPLRMPTPLQPADKMDTPVVQPARRVNREPSEQSTTRGGGRGGGVWETMAATTGYMTGMFKKASPYMQRLARMVEVPVAEEKEELERKKSFPVSEHDSVGDLWVPSTAGSTFARRHSSKGSLKSALRAPSDVHSTVYSTTASEAATPTAGANPIGWMTSMVQPPMHDPALLRRQTENTSLYGAFQREREDRAPFKSDTLFGLDIPDTNTKRFHNPIPADASYTTQGSGFYSRPTTPLQTLYDRRARSSTVFQGPN
eukprot:TRINITY_DN8276_c0_g1_i1.p1 TRINITY_DN8276_c0_g1~~TRINITY_DN8276_c0_g1_i1.p1  ORF type:complete len:1176 (+),score=285.57 TRINITY_DN8276_c0_g1_i1:37-3564(+)